ncbi:dihydrofolate reductase family protein [Corynebacterium sp. A21]|uniref:dihydrofolate reductase family protein n=1 Tax=Corynebacterium sp. A21 TaxID=3457318 RepID=UPI003FD68B3E
MAIIYNAATTMNGFIADENNSLQWLFEVAGSDEAEDDIGNFLAGVSTLVMGSTTYEWLIREMDLLNNPQAWIDAYGDRPNWVFSSRNLPIPEGTNIKVINSSVGDALPRIRDTAGEGNIWVMGGGDLVGQFFDIGALDRIILTMAPVFLPAGAPTLPRRIESAQLRTAGTRQVGRFLEVTFEVLPG